MGKKKTFFFLFVGSFYRVLSTSLARDKTNYIDSRENLSAQTTVQLYHTFYIGALNTCALNSFSCGSTSKTKAVAREEARGVIKYDIFLYVSLPR